jgi:hypothetical protein
MGLTLELETNSLKKNGFQSCKKYLDPILQTSEFASFVLPRLERFFKVENNCCKIFTTGRCM